MKKPLEPNFNTNKADFSKEELNKIASNGIIGTLPEELRNNLPDISWEAEQLGKSNGFYLEFDRAVKGSEKNWIFMVRVGIPGGGPLTRAQYNLFHELSEKYTKDPGGQPSLRLTTRQAIQFHWVKKPGVLDIVKQLAEGGLNSLNGCGDNTRNVMTCPVSRHSKLLDTNAITMKIAKYFQLPVEPFIKIFEINPELVAKPEKSFRYGPNLLNRKFKIGISSLIKDEKTGQYVPDNCVEVLTNDMAIVPLLENNQVTRYQIYVGGGQGERNGKPSLATLAKPLTIATEENLMVILDGVVSVHQKWGDRQNRVWARLKYVIEKQGIEWFRQKVSEHVGFELEQPIENYNHGDRHLHHGWFTQENNGLLSYGMYIENGRIVDNSPNGKLKSLVHHLMNQYPATLSLTANQDLIFSDIPPGQKDNFEADLMKYGYGQRNNTPYSTLRKESGACVGRDTCRLTYTDSEKFEPELIDELERLGWGNLKESIGITGCERQCFRPSTKSIGLIGTGLNRYQFRLFGDVGARHQGRPVISEDGNEMYLRSVPREEVAMVIDALFKFYQANQKTDESLGECFRRLKADAIINHLKSNSATSHLMDKPFNTDCVI